MPGDDISRSPADKKTNSLPAEHGSPLPEFINRGYEEKEVALHAPQPIEPSPQQDGRPKYSEICGIPKKLFFLLIALLAAVVIALAVGLGVGLREKKNSSHSKTSQSDEYLIGGAISPKYFSTAGAFNGSGIALASQSFSASLATGTEGTLVMYFQHWSGQIRWQQLSNSGQWLGGDISTIVADDARNSTPISAVSFNLNQTSIWHIFYIDTNNIIRQKSNSNTTNVWTDGPINSLNLPTLAEEEVGLQACYAGGDYGTGGDYAHSPLPNSGNFTNEVGMHIWYASDNTTFQQYGWAAGDNKWVFEKTWPDKNGHAGVGCYSWGPGTVQYAMLVNLENTVEIYWRDTNTTLANTTSHPVGVWVNSSIAINDVYPSTSLGYTNYFYAQMNSSNAINGYNITWAAENTTIQEPFAVDGDAGLPGTHMSVTALPNSSGGNNILVFYQTNGSDITEHVRDLVAGQWTSVQIPIPES